MARKKKQKEVFCPCGKSLGHSPPPPYYCTNCGNKIHFPTTAKSLKRAIKLEKLKDKQDKGFFPLCSAMGHEFSSAIGLNFCGYCGKKVT